MTTLTDRFPVKVGTTLPNGAVVLDSKKCRDGSAVVICMWLGGGAPEYVTWRLDPTRLDSTVSGGYWQTLADAMLDYNERN